MARLPSSRPTGPFSPYLNVTPARSTWSNQAFSVEGMPKLYIGAPMITVSGKTGRGLDRLHEAILKAHAVNLLKICGDLRLLSSGPDAGLAAEPSSQGSGDQRMDIEGAGAVVTSGLVAGAIEKPTGKAGDDHAHGVCSDCGAETSGNFCANCGQPTHVHRSLLHLGEELLHGVMHFDGRLWRTLPLLILNPGRLTREWVQGKRTRFVSPLAMFLFTLFGLLIKLIGDLCYTLLDPRIDFSARTA